MKASLKTLIQSGTLGPIEPGMHRSAIEQTFGSPDDWMASTPTFHKSPIWKYGDVELHFEGDSLSMIFMDDLANPAGGPKMDLDPWIINDGLTCAEAEGHLVQAGIEFTVADFSHNDNGIHLTTTGGTTLAFAGDDAACVTLHWISRRLPAAV